MDRFGLIGYPIAGSLSPMLFSQAYHGRRAYDLIEEPDFERAWERFLSEYKAVNVTAPYKEAAFARADLPSEASRAIGACNILVRTEKGVAAHNSDFLGVKSILSELDVTAGTTLVIGYGGAGKAAEAAARALGYDVVVCNRSTDKAAGIRPLEEIPLLAGISDVVIYTLPCPIPETAGMQCPVLLEANYRTPSLERAPGIGRYVSGREWILRQAVLGYALMTGEEPDSNNMSL